METKMLLSSMASPSHLAVVGQPIAADAVRLVRLSGQMHGRFTNSLSLPDTGQQTLIFGTGNLHGLGKTLIAGSLHSVGFIASGQATGSITLFTRRGSLSITLTGPTQSGPSGLPTTLNYQVTKGMGAFRNVSDRGTVELLLTSSTKADGTPHGSFKLRFHSGASAV
jgi:hypothetical protein